MNDLLFRWILFSIILADAISISVRSSLLLGSLFT